MTQRATHSGEPLSYAAIGASQAVDLMYYPPKGYRPREDKARLGSGQARFDAAVATMFSWGIQRGSGIQVTHVELPQGSEQDYAGIVYDEDGTPLHPRENVVEHTYSEDGTPEISAGVTADLIVPALRQKLVAPVRVVIVVDEPRQKGYALGTLPGHPLEGEFSFVVTHEDDDSVWLTVRSFSKPSSRGYQLARPLVKAVRDSLVKRYLRALLPGRTL